MSDVRAPALLAGLVGCQLDGAGAALPAEPLGDRDWRALLSAAIDGRVQGPLAWAIAGGDLAVTDEQQAAAFAAHRTAMVKACMLERLLVDVDDLFDRAGIDYRVLKGPAVAHLDEADPALRSFYDLDLLVRARQIETARDLLVDGGGRRRYPEPRRGFDRRFGKGMCIVLPDGLAIDLHRTLAPGPFGMRLDLDDLFASGDVLVVGGRSVRTLDRPRRFVHACFHAVLGQAVPRLAQLRDVIVTCPRDVGVSTAWALAGRSGAREVVAAAVETTVDVLGWQPPPTLEALLSSRPSDRRGRRWLRSYRGDQRSGARQALWTFDAVAGLRAKTAYAAAVGLPAAHPGGAGRLGRARSGLADLVRTTAPVSPLDVASRPRPDVVALEIDDHLVVHDRSAARAHLLNPSAALVWRCLGEGMSVDEVVRGVTERTGMDSRTLTSDVDDAVARFGELDLLGAARGTLPRERGSRLDDATRSCSPSLPAPRSGDDVSARIGPLAALDHHFVVHCADTALAARLASGFATLPAGSRERSTLYDVYGSDADGWTVGVEGRIVRRASTIDEAVGFLWWHVQRVAVDTTDRMVRLHAAGVTRGGSVVALPAPSGAGKSTLVADLVAHGFGYVTDEVVAFDPVSREVRPLPMPIKLHHGPTVMHDVIPAGNTEWSPRLAACVFHRYEAGAATRVRRMSRPQALVALLENAFGLATAQPVVLDGLRSVALDVPCYELVRGDVASADLPRAVDRIMSSSACLVGQAGSTTMEPVIRSG